MNSQLSKKDISPQKLRVYQIIFSMFIQLILVIVGIIAFFIILFAILKAENNWTKIIYAALDSMLVGTLYLVYKYFFPVKTKK